MGMIVESVGMYKNTMNKCKRVLDYMASKALKGTIKVYLSLPLGSFRDDKNRTIFIKPIVKRWRSILVNESSGVYYLGLDMQSMCDLNITALYDMTDYDEALKTNNIKTLSSLRRYMKCSTDYMVEYDSNTYTREEFERDYNELRATLDEMEISLRDKVVYIVKNRKDYDRFRKVSEGRKYIPLLIVDFNSKEILSYSRYGRGYISKSPISKDTSIEDQVSSILMNNFGDILDLYFMTYEVSGVNNFSV